MNRTQQFYLRTSQRHDVRKGDTTITRLWALTDGEPVLVYSSANAADVARIHARILQSLAWSDGLTARAPDTLADIL